MVRTPCRNQLLVRDERLSATGVKKGMDSGRESRRSDAFYDGPGWALVVGVRFSGFHAAGSHGVCAAAGEARWSTSVGVTRGPGELGIWRGYDVTSELADRTQVWIT
jgi:hypothetical protein